MDPTVPEAARPILSLLVEQLRSLDVRVAELDREIGRRAREDAEAKRLMTIPGIGPITATALAALAPSAQTFRRGRDFAAWLGLTPLQRSSGGKQKLGETPRMGERTLRRLLIIGASAAVRWGMRKGSTGIRGFRGCLSASHPCWSSSPWLRISQKPDRGSANSRTVVSLMSGQSGGVGPWVPCCVHG